MLRNPNLRAPAAKQGMVLAVAVLVAAGVGAIFALGRGGGGESAEAASATPGIVSGSGEASRDSGSFDDFAQCLEAQGVAPPQPGAQGQRPDDDALRSAFEACRAYAPDLGGGNGMFGDPEGDDGAAPPVPALPHDDSGGDLDSDTPTL